MAGSDNKSDDASVHSEATNAQQQPNIQPQSITIVSNNNAKFSYLKKDGYEVWAIKMEYWITNNDMNIWKVIQNGNSLKRTERDRDGRVIILLPTTADEHIAVQRESKAKTTLIQSIPDDHVADFYYMNDARDIWNAVKARFGGNAESKKMRKSMLKQEFLEFRIVGMKGQQWELKKDEYEVWAMKMEYWIKNNDMNIWKVIQNGNNMKRDGRDHDGSVISLPSTIAEEHIAVQRESKARTT
nr:xylulose kinase-1 [Tanacetum cinerariifolium]